MVPCKEAAYDMHRLVRLIVHDGELFEIEPFRGASLITGLALDVDELVEFAEQRVTRGLGDHGCRRYL
jgi:hypothetical protein